MSSAKSGNFGATPSIPRVLKYCQKKRSGETEASFCTLKYKKFLLEKYFYYCFYCFIDFIYLKLSIYVSE